MGQRVADLGRDTAAFFTGGTSGIKIGRGEAPTTNTIATDAAGLAAGAGIAASGIAGSSALTGNTVASMPPAVPAGAAAGGGTLSTLANTATILAPITSLAAAAGGIAAARRAQAPLNVPEATPAPSFGGPNTILATRASTTEQLRRRGRASTILTSPGGESLGAA